MKTHNTNRYRRQDKIDAYEVALLWVYNMSNELLDGMLCDENVAILQDSYPTLSIRNARQIIAKAIRVERVRQLNVSEVIE